MTNSDFVKDANPKPLYMAGLHTQLPAYVLEFNIPSTTDISTLANQSFANPMERLHPIHTKEAAFLSGIYLLGHGMEESPEMQAVKQAAEIFSIEEDLAAVFSQLRPLMMGTMQKQANALPYRPAEYAMTVEQENGSIDNYYPISTEFQIEKSARDLYEDFVNNRLPADWAHKAAKQIVNKMDQLGMSRNNIPERISILGTERLPNFDTAEKMASLRGFDGADNDSQPIYVEIVKAARADQGNIDEYMKLWADLDMTQGISYKSTCTPQEAFYSGPAVADLEKMASNVVIIRDVMVPAVEVASISSEEIRRSFRTEIADVMDSVVKLASVNPPMASKYISVLDTDNQDIILNILLSR